MEDIIDADIAGRGVSDISGVKDQAPTNPEGSDGEMLRDADEVADVERSLSETEQAALEAEFDVLINGKFSQIYKKRTEGIVRKRLRSVKAVQPGNKAEPGEAKKPTAEKSRADTQMQVSEEKARTVERNRTRPLENGLGGSCATVSRINVSALSGREIVNILKRAGTGERITFK